MLPEQPKETHTHSQLSDRLLHTCPHLSAHMHSAHVKHTQVEASGRSHELYHWVHLIQLFCLFLLHLVSLLIPSHVLFPSCFQVFVSTACVSMKAPSQILPFSFSTSFLLLPSATALLWRPGWSRRPRTSSFPAGPGAGRER